MLLALLLQAVPTPHPLVTTLFSALLAGLATWLWTSRSERRAAKAKAAEAEEKRLRDVAEAARLAEADKNEWDRLLERVGKTERDIRDFVGKTALDEQFEAIRKRVDTAGHFAKTLQDAQQGYQQELTRLAGDVRHCGNEISDLRGLTPRVGKVETDLARLIEQMQSLKDGQQEIKGDLRELRKDIHEDRDAILDAIRKTKP